MVAPSTRYTWDMFTRRCVYKSIWICVRYGSYCLRDRAIAPEARLSETLGLRSMDLAQIVLTLEDDLDCDPFQEIPITSIRTVGDLTGAYLAALGLAEAARPGAQDMAAEMAAARARQARRRR